LALKKSNAKLGLKKIDEVVGWGNLSIVKSGQKKTSDAWVEQYVDDSVISQEGSQDPTTMLILSNSSAINYGLKNNSNALLNYSGGGVFTVLERQELLEDVRTDSHAFVSCCKNTSNALIYGLKNNSSTLIRLHAGVFTVPEKQEFLEHVCTTSNAFLFCCKNTSNAFAYNLKNNSNAIVRLRTLVFSGPEKQLALQTSRTTSNGFLYCCKNTSNALVFGIRNNSNALINWPGGALWSIYEKDQLYETIRTYSNTIIMINNGVTIYDDHQVYDDDAIEQNFVFFKNGFSVKPDKTLTLDVPVPISGNINLGDTGSVLLQRDMLFASDAYLTGGGKIDGNGFALVLSCTFAIPENETLQITSDTIINGHGTTLYFEPHAQITIDNNVTLTLKNFRVESTRNSNSDPIISMSGSDSCLTLMNMELALADDYYVNNGRVFIHDDVIISGTSSFVYKSEQASYVAPFATWAFDKGSRFYYDPSVSDNSLVRMHSKTSGMYFDGSTLEAGNMGVRLSKGSLYFDNNVLLKCPESTQIIFGDLSQSDSDLDVYVLGGAYVEIEGVVFDDSV